MAPHGHQGKLVRRIGRIQKLPQRLAGHGDRVRHAAAGVEDNRGRKGSVFGGEADDLLRNPALEQPEVVLAEAGNETIGAVDHRRAD